MAQSQGEGLTREQAHAQLLRFNQYRQNPHLVSYLHWKYADAPLAVRAGQQYPIALFPMPYELQQDSERVLSKPLQPEPEGYPLMANSAYRDAIAQSERQLFNGKTFTMQALSLNHQIPMLQCSTGDYFSMLDTCDSLEWEAVSHADLLNGSDEHDFLQFDRHLPQRSALHQKVPSPVHDGAYRSVGLSISMLIAYRHNDEIHLLLRRRSARVAISPLLIHVIPAFMFQPMTDHIDQEYSIRHNIFREYLEELFGVREARSDEHDWRYFYQDARLKALEHWLNVGEAHLLVTGVTVPLLNLRPEISVLLYIDSDSWYQRHMASDANPYDRIFCNEEYQNDDSGETILKWDPGMSDQALLDRYPMLNPSQIVPSGAGTFWLGIDALRALVAKLAETRQ